MKVIESVEDHYEAQEAPFGKLHRRRPEMNVAECECGGRLALSSFPPGGRGTDKAPAIQENRYSWLDDCLEWLEGKEARHEYYARLEEEQATPCRDEACLYGRGSYPPGASSLFVPDASINNCGPQRR